MCTATLGAAPVYLCTCAASSIFSWGVRGTPGWLNTLNLVPLLPKAHEGVSIWCAATAALTAATVRIYSSFVSSSVEVEDLVDPAESLVGPLVAGAFEEFRHFRLPGGVDLGACHRGAGGIEVVCLQVADQQAIVGQEQAVVVPACLSQGRPHVGPHGFVSLDVLIQPVRPDPSGKAHSLHGDILRGGWALPRPSAPCG